MAHRHNPDVLDRIFRDTMRSTVTFGGNFSLCSGDFLQILPAVEAGNRSQILNGFFKRSTLFFTVYSVSTKPKQAITNNLSEWERKWGCVTVCIVSSQCSWKQVSSRKKQKTRAFIILKLLTNNSRVSNNNFPNIRTNYKNNSLMRKCVVRTTQNIQIEQITESIEGMTSCKERFFLSTDNLKYAGLYDCDTPPVI